MSATAKSFATRLESRGAPDPLRPTARLGAFGAAGRREEPEISVGGDVRCCGGCLWSWGNQAELERGWIMKGDTPADIAGVIEADPAHLPEMIEWCNEECAVGADFHSCPPAVPHGSHPGSSPAFGLRVWGALAPCGSIAFRNHLPSQGRFPFWLRFASQAKSGRFAWISAYGRRHRGVGERACKPGSVGDGHLSRTRVASRL